MAAVLYCYTGCFDNNFDYKVKFKPLSTKEKPIVLSDDEKDFFSAGLKGKFGRLFGFHINSFSKS